MFACFFFFVQLTVPNANGPHQRCMPTRTCSCACMCACELAPSPLLFFMRSLTLLIRVRRCTLTLNKISPRMHTGLLSRPWGVHKPFLHVPLPVCGGPSRRPPAFAWRPSACCLLGGGGRGGGLAGLKCFMRPAAMGGPHMTGHFGPGQPDALTMTQPCPAALGQPRLCAKGQARMRVRQGMLGLRPVAHAAQPAGCLPPEVACVLGL